VNSYSLRALVTVMAITADSVPAATNPMQVAQKKTKSAAKKPRTMPVQESLGANGVLVYGGTVN